MNITDKILCWLSVSYRNHAQIQEEVLCLRSAREEQLKKIAELGSQITILSSAAAKANERAVEVQSQFNALTNRECPTCAALKQVANFHVLAAGSRVKMFDGIGPTLPEPKPMPPVKPTLPTRAGQAVRMTNRNFVQEFQRQQASQATQTPEAPPLDSENVS